MDGLDELKRQSIKVSGFYAMSERDDFRSYAERILNCAEHLDFAMQNIQGDLVGFINNVHWCRCPRCPLCQWAKVGKWRAKFFQGLRRLYLENEVNVIFVTLTSRNCCIKGLRDELELMASAFNRLLSSLRRSGVVVGYIKALEVTWSLSQFGDTHPHYHVMFFLSGGRFPRWLLDDMEWSRMWARSLQVDYQPVCKAKFCRSGDLKSILELVKYCVKPSDLSSDPDWLYDLTDQLYKKRSLTVGGIVSQYVKQSMLDRIDCVGRSGDEQNQDGLPASLDWDYIGDRYILNLGVAV
ncbi:Replication protein [Coleofasciculus chthonoplastes PCC 7420]|uniref:Replication protein n=1 Tax=Coleofasciculus chthonoplastes PCC 7420 TaxID=118168 RepID=B4VY68_9CYAN|nr:Replication protein [Coleofasciculus chthonoplastes PCC 7420]